MSQHEQWDIVSGVGVTALAVALARAIDTHRPDGIAKDPFAERFLAATELPEPFASTWPTVAEGAAAERGSWWDSMPTYMAARTRFFDDFFAEAGAAGLRQVVLLAAGLDTRAFRLDWADGTELYEVDQAMVLKFKDEVLDAEGARPRCARHVVAADLRDDWVAELRAAGFDPTRPTAWLAEGLLAFLPARAEADLFARVRELSAPGSWFAVEAIAGDVRHMSHYGPPAENWQAHVGVDVTTLWNAELRPHPVDVLRSDGWTVAVERVADCAQRNGRYVTGAMQGPANHSMLLAAKR